MTMAFKLDYAAEMASSPQQINLHRTLNALAGTNLSEREAHEVLPYIQKHKWFVSERLGRDVGIKVAAIDYLENVYVSRPERAKSAKIWRKLIAPLRTMGAQYLTHMSWKANEGVVSSFDYETLPIDGVGLNNR